MPAYKAYWFETYETRLMRLTHTHTHTISIGAEIVKKNYTDIVIQ